MAEYFASGDRLATIFGGSGFIGRYIAQSYARKGWRVRVAVRRPDLAGYVMTYGVVGQVLAVQANVRYPDSVASAVEGAEVVINACGIQRQSGGQNFEAVHARGAEAIARAAKAAGARALVLVSGIGSDPDASNPYIASKARGEQATRAAFPAASILRPSVVFGPEDQFFNRFAELARFLPVLPAFAEGKAKLQPVYAGDVALAAAKAMDETLGPGVTYDLGGPEVMTLRQAMETALRYAERQRAIVPLPFGVSRLMARGTELASDLSLGMFPAMLTTTRDQIDLLREDNVVSPQAIAEGRTFAGLGIQPRGVETVLPAYMSRFRKTGQYAPNRFA